MKELKAAIEKFQIDFKKAFSDEEFVQSEIFNEAMGDFVAKALFPSDQSKTLSMLRTQRAVDGIFDAFLGVITGKISDPKDVEEVKENIRISGNMVMSMMDMIYSFLVLWTNNE